MKKLNLIVAVLPLATLFALASSTRCFAESVASAKPVAKKAVVKKPLKVKIDLSSPERTVRSFVAAFSSNDFVSAAECVQVKGNKVSLAILEKRYLRDNDIVASTLESFRVSINGNSALVSFSWTVLESDGTQQNYKGTCEVVRHKGWRLVPYAKNDLHAYGNHIILRSAPWKHDSLRLIATFIARPEETLREMKKVDTVVCDIHIGQMSLALLNYAKACNGKFSLKTSDFPNAVLPFRDTKPFPLRLQCPVDEKNEISYSFNSRLEEVARKDIKFPAKTVMLYEGRNGQLHF